MYLDDLGAIHRRPGLSELFNISDTLNTVEYWWQDGNMLITVASNGQIYKTTRALGAYTTTNITGDALTGLRHPTFVSNGTVLIIANGGRMVFTDGTTNTAYIGDVDAPTNVSHVVFWDQYIVANSIGSSTFWYSEVNDYTDWRALNFFTAESSPDNIDALIINRQELLLLGDRSGETWQNNGVDPFRRVDSLHIDRGISAPSSLIRAFGTLYFLDHEWNVVKMVNRAPTSISKAIEKSIKAFSTVSDAVGDVLNADGRNFYVLTFPTENTTFVYDVALDRWYKWGFWNTYTNTYDRWGVMGITFAKSWGITIAGNQRSTGKILALSPTYINDDGDVIRYKVTTGADSYGVPNEKIGNHILLRADRGIGDVGGSDPLLMTRFRDNRRAWGVETRYSMGDPGDTDTELYIPAPGTFRNREWELTYTDEGPFVIASGSEFIEVLQQ
jgi:hypothetical protein